MGSEFPNARVFGKDVSISPPEYPPQGIGPLQLDKLVLYTAAHTQLQQSRIINLKTDLDEGSAVSGIMFRYAARHHMTILKQVHDDVEKGFFMYKDAPQADIALALMSKRFLSVPFERIIQQYNEKMPGAVFLTEMRDPVQHLIAKFRQSCNCESSLVEIASSPILGEFANYQAREFNLQTDIDVANFIDRHVKPNVDARSDSGFAMVIIADQLDESLVLMRRMFNWGFIDITELHQQDGAGQGGTRTMAGERFYHLPREHFHNTKVTEKTNEEISSLQKIKGVLRHDFLLYEAAKARHAELQDIYFEDEKDWNSDVLAYKRLNAYVNQFCDKHLDAGVCEWYRQDEKHFEWEASHSGGKPTAEPFYPGNRVP